MAAYEPPRRYSNTRPYDDNMAYNGQPPQVQVQPAQYPPPPPQHQSSYQRARGSSNASQRSNYIPPQPIQQQQLTPYAQSPQQQQYQQSPQQGGYFPQAPPGQYSPDQLHPAQAYNQQDPFAYRQRTASTSSAASRRSHRSSHSHHSHHSHGSALSDKGTEHVSGRKDGQRATLGDSLYGIWGTMKSMIPVRR